MKSTNILLCLCAITLCTSICIAETSTTTKTYYQPTKTTTTTVIDQTTNPLYSVNRNNKIEAVQPQQSTPKTITTTTTTAVTEPLSKVKTTATTTSSTVKTTVIDKTTNPMYSIDRNDKIQAALDKQISSQTMTTTAPSTVKTTVVEKTTNTLYSAKQNSSNVAAKAQETVSNLEKDVENELAYYESLRTCTTGSLNNPKLSLRTYGMKDGLCSFDIAQENPKTGRMVTVCKINAPMDATKKYAENKLKYERSLVGLEKISTAEYTALTSSLSTFTQQYCK